MKFTFTPGTYHVICITRTAQEYGHGSHYNTDGEYLDGPAPRSLDRRSQYRMKSRDPDLRDGDGRDRERKVTATRQ